MSKVVRVPDRIKARLKRLMREGETYGDVVNKLLNFHKRNRPDAPTKP